MTFDELVRAWDWRPIPNCPGRCRLAAKPPHPPLADLVGDNVEVRRFQVQAARDEVLVVRLPGGGGLISYQRGDGSLIHTLNTPEGFERKLAQLEIEVEAT